MRTLLAKTVGTQHMRMLMRQKNDGWYVLWTYDETFGKHKRARTSAKFSIGPMDAQEVQEVFRHMQSKQ